MRQIFTRKTLVCTLIGFGWVIACSKNDSPTGERAQGGGAAGESAGDGDSGDGDGDGNGGTSGDGDAALPEGLLEYCDAIHAYMCEFAETCFGEKDCEAENLPYVQGATCDDAFLDLVRDQKLVFHPDVAASCIPDEVVCAHYPRWLFDYQCVDVFTGTLDPGQACEHSGTFLSRGMCLGGTCEQDENCDSVCLELPGKGEDCLEGRCQASLSCSADETCIEPVGPGESCETLPCQNGLTCNDEKICADFQKVGESCGGGCSSQLFCNEDDLCANEAVEGGVCGMSAHCPDGNVCYQSDDGGKKTCQEPIPEGQPCPFGGCDEQNGISCVDPDPNNDDFEERECIALGKNDESCEPYGCRANLWCRYTMEAPDGVCSPQGGPGDDCETLDGPRSNENSQCLIEDDLHCIQGECAQASDLGGPCEVDDSSTCAEGTCSLDEEKCVEPRPIGEACAPEFGDRACEAGAYCDFDTEKCEEQKENGAICSSEIECKEGGCQWVEEDGVDRCMGGSVCQ